MKILITIPHFYKASNKGDHGSSRKDPQPRIRALTESILALHQNFGISQRMIEHYSKLAVKANGEENISIDIVICTTQEQHILKQLELHESLFSIRESDCEPLLLGYECHRVLKENLGKYDYYCFLEDDIIIHDPLFFSKLNWFNSRVGHDRLLQPNRFEYSTQQSALKCYIDGDLRPGATGQFQNVNDEPTITGQALGKHIRFKRPLNPHSGCFFLNQEQMKQWSQLPYFLDCDTSFIGPLESAASLGIMKTFKVYKPLPECANFLEVQHYGTAFTQLIGREVSLAGS
ncbi:hypothetical protein [Marinomonas ostreistagni]|uniref:Calcium-binding protein n=1 Tax=Marinomonas ostreistagni TaxID=359209 RepID=A0ABS0ZBU5_9GAMM|nr:hypothetical protein [Marinomonas ostreistagni]MBJ7551131.1 hypothetical protein [Marinomonas ostreistagni]